MPSERALREKICEIGRLLYDRGHIAPMDGNISARLSERYLLCTPTGCHKGRMTSDQIVKLASANGRPVDSAQRASTEIKMHLAIFEERPDVHGIVHAHSPYAVGLSVAGVSLERPVVPEAILALGGVPTVPYASPTTSDVPNAVLKYLCLFNAFILERHGPVALGDTLDQAFSRLEIVEHTARITVAALAAGGAQPIPQDEADHLRKMAIEAGFLRNPEGCVSGLPNPPIASAARAAPTHIHRGALTSEDALIDELVRRVVARLRVS